MKKHACSGCNLEFKCKNNPTCKACIKKLEYVNKIGFFPDGHNMRTKPTEIPKNDFWEGKEVELQPLKAGALPIPVVLLKTQREDDKECKTEGCTNKIKAWNKSNLCTYCSKKRLWAERTIERKAARLELRRKLKKAIAMSVNI